VPERIFGHIPGYPEGASFASRAELSEAGVHRPTMAGISGSQSEGADSIVLSGGYEDDEDLGVEVVYTGHGGRDAESRRQVAHQQLTKGISRWRKAASKAFRSASYVVLTSTRRTRRAAGTATMGSISWTTSGRNSEGPTSESGATG
jgi:predicted restriction endonuclease